MGKYRFIYNPITKQLDLVNNDTTITPTGQTGGVVIVDKVDTYSLLPVASGYTGNCYLVLNDEGTSWLPGSLGGTFYAKGVYYSNGSTWILMSSIPYQATQDETNAGVVDNVFVTPLKLSNYSGFTTYQKVINNFVFVSVKSDFPTPSGGIITLLANTTYFITTTIDLTGDRLVCSANTTIIGGSSENCRIKSTGLVSALITSVHSLPLRNITIESALALDLDGDGVTTALDWFGVNFTDCAVIGTVKDYTNFIMSDCAFLNSGGMTLDGTMGTVGFSNSLFNCNPSNTVFILPSTLTITRRFRIIYSSFIVLSGETGINVNASAVIPTESYILDTVNFSGGGTYLTGVTHTSNDSLFINCVGITNTAVNGQLYMQGNATATTVSATNTFYKVAGTTTASADNSKFSHSNNRLTCDAVISRKYLIQAHLSFSSGANNVCEFGFYDSVLATVRTPSKTRSTANATGNAENISFACVVTMGLNDYIEVHCSNTSASSNITVSQLNFAITEIK